MAVSAKAYVAVVQGDIRSSQPRSIGESGKAGSHRAAERLQTLERGLLVLVALAAEPTGLTAAEIAERIDVHRPIAYRLLATLDVTGMVVRDDRRRYHLGLGIVRLARAVLPQLSVAGVPVLRRLATQTRATAFLAMAEGNDAVAVAVVEPPNADIHVAYRIGVRHRLDQGASGIAILAGRPPSSEDLPAVVEARRRGYARSAGELQGGAVGIAVPLSVDGEPIDMSVGLVTLSASGIDIDKEIPLLQAAASSIAALIDPGSTSSVRDVALVLGT